ncbi:MAG: hypothetical protein GX780_02550 [Campylobacteraceae bacterium]|nr:hypothetical protein [Campylobacteraceae bacterium]
MVASAFAYYNYRFAQYKFIDFDNWIFYEEATIFEPESSCYTLVVFSSNQRELYDLVLNLTKDCPIVGIDLYQHRKKFEDNTIQISAGMNTLLPFLQRFEIYEIPVAFRIEQQNGTLYKQDSPIEVLP